MAMTWRITTESIRDTERSAILWNLRMAVNNVGCEFSSIWWSITPRTSIPGSKRRASDPKSKYREWYVWATKKPKNAKSGIVFPGVQKSTWNYDKVAKAYYFHRFYDFQPDLNTANPEVQAEILKIMGFWLQLGVSGFRMDAVPFVIAKKGANLRRSTEQYDMLRTLSEFLTWRKSEAIILGEANIRPETDLKYFGDSGERLTMMFNFEVNQHLFYALASGDSRSLMSALHATNPRPATAQWGQFLRNHDELDLGRLTDKQRETVFAAFGPTRDMQLYRRGIRRRLAPMLQGDRRRLELAYSLMMTLPGTPVIRYGDEIAMGDDLTLPERNCARTPMQWSTEPNAGFTKNRKPFLPVISDGPYGFEHVNVADQRRKPNSFLNWMERIIRMRKEVPEIAWGTFKFLSTKTPQVLAMRYDWRGNSVLCIHNLSAEPREVRFSLELEEKCTLVNLLSEDHSHPEKKSVHCILMEPYGYRWFRICGLDYLLKRTDA